MRVAICDCCGREMRQIDMLYGDTSLCDRCKIEHQSAQAITAAGGPVHAPRAWWRNRWSRAWRRVARRVGL